ncbi:MAG: hypothetical protein ACW99U_01865 [Candidatus Thorarchaeota archaeon]
MNWIRILRLESLRICVGDVHWQVRQFAKDDVSFFLTALSKGVLTPVPEIPDKTERIWWKDFKDWQEKAVEQLAEAVEAERSSEDFGSFLVLDAGVAELLVYVNSNGSCSWRDDHNTHRRNLGQSRSGQCWLGIGSYLSRHVCAGYDIYFTAKYGWETSWKAMYPY